jgi:hypothetical protein
MNFSQDCPSCNRTISLKYDEMDGTPVFCPFCAGDIGEEGAYEDTPGIPGAEEEDWADDDR